MKILVGRQHPLLRVLLFALLFTTTFSGKNPTFPDTLNLGFEQLSVYEEPVNWNVAGGLQPTGNRGNITEEQGAIGSLDTKIVHGGKRSLSIEMLPAGFYARGICTSSDSLHRLLKGKTITYSGWIKIKDITKSAGLWWRVDGKNHRTLAFNNMDDTAYHGTHDWKRFSFTLPVSEAAVNIDFGVIVHGKEGGKVWFDDLQIDTNGVLFAK